jgi:hypothetical protein
MWKAAIAVLYILVPFRLLAQEPATPSNQAAKHKPHMIELSSANWRPLSRKEKAQLFEYDLLHWETHASLLFDAGISAALANRPYLGVGVPGYFRNYGMNAADEVNFVFFSGFLFPTLFHEDPRYIPLDKGLPGQRLKYALTRVLVARTDAGKSRFNASHLLGTLVATSASSAYYSGLGAEASVKGNFASFGVNIGSDIGFDLLKEFWPDAARKLKINLWIRNVVRGALRDSIKIN